MSPVDAVGWIASLVLVLTISRQVWKQWKDHSTQGVSKWLFTGQITASIGFVVYSWLLGNWVFVVTNAFLLVTAITGQVLYARTRREERAAS